jgi:hypothetical protein
MQHHALHLGICSAKYTCMRLAVVLLLGVEHVGVGFGMPSAEQPEHAVLEHPVRVVEGYGLAYTLSPGLCVWFVVQGRGGFCMKAGYISDCRRWISARY